MQFNIKGKLIILFILFISTAIGFVCFLIIPTIYDIIDIKNNINFQYADLESKYLRGQTKKQTADILARINPELIKLGEIVFEMKDGKSEPVNMDECLGCESCVEVCPKSAITVKEV